MLGNVFSPYYARQRELGVTNPLEYCTINVASYDKGCSFWTLTERRSALRSPDHIEIGQSRFSASDDAVSVDISERTAPFGTPVRGHVRVTPSRWLPTTHVLDDPGRHRWSPLALNAEAEVEIVAPTGRKWSGHAYVDTNHGDEPLERGFRRWDWSRATTPSGTHVVYDVERRDGSCASIRKTFRPTGSISELGNVGITSLPRTVWGIRRSVPSDDNAPATVVRCLENTPFYARTLAHGTIDGEPAHIVHETVDMDRFVQRWVRFLIPFRMRTAA